MVVKFTNETHPNNIVNNPKIKNQDEDNLKKNLLMPGKSLNDKTKEKKNLLSPKKKLAIIAQLNINNHKSNHKGINLKPLRVLPNRLIKSKSGLFIEV